MAVNSERALVILLIPWGSLHISKQFCRFHISASDIHPWPYSVGKNIQEGIYLIVFLLKRIFSASLYQVLKVFTCLLEGGSIW